MARIAVIGGSGRTGKLIVKALAAQGDEVVATIRNPRHMAEMARLGAIAVIIDLDTSPLADFTIALGGADAVVFAAGSAAGESSALDRKGMVRSIRAAKKANVPLFLTIASIGASTGMRLEGKWATDEMRDYYKQKRAGNKALRESELNWIIVEPGELTDKKGTGKVELTTKPIEEGRIPRGDVAAVVVALLAEPKAIGKAFQLVSGETAIAAAVKKAVGKK